VINDQILVNASRYLIYHLRMHIETLELILKFSEQPKVWDTIRNSIIEAYLVNTRVLIEFITRETPYQDTIFAYQYFQGTEYDYFPVSKKRKD